MGLLKLMRDYWRLSEQAEAERRGVRAPAAPTPRPAPSPAPQRAPSPPRAPRVRVATLDESALRVRDLQHLDAVRTRIRGSMHVVKDSERAAFGGSDYLLVREPENRADPRAVAVYGRNRRVGYLSASKAAVFAPLIDADTQHDAFRVAGSNVIEGEDVRLWVELPRLPGLRAELRT